MLQRQQQHTDGCFGRLVPPMKPMSQRDRTYARKHAIFLIRNITRQERHHPEETQQEKSAKRGIDPTALEKGRNIAAINAYLFTLNKLNAYLLTLLVHCRESWVLGAC